MRIALPTSENNYWLSGFILHFLVQVYLINKYVYFMFKGLDHFQQFLPIRCSSFAPHLLSHFPVTRQPQ